MKNWTTQNVYIANWIATEIPRFVIFIRKFVIKNIMIDFLLHDNNN